MAITPTTTQPDVGNLLRDRRTELGFTQAEIAELAGVPRGTYWNWETRCTIGSDPASTDAATRVALALRISPKRIIPGRRGR